MNRRSLTLLIKRFLSGSTTPEEDDFLRRYDALFESKSLQEVAEEENEIYGKELFDRINARIQKDKRNKIIRLTQFRVLLRVASIVLVLCVSFLAYLNRNKIIELADPVQYREVHVAAGKTRSLLLADGTRVLLNAGSKLKYPNKFRGSLREVDLEGEGYFEVVKNPAQPFLVRTPALRVQVLGTKFNVRSYQGDAKQQVSVITGKVEVDDSKSAVAKPVMLTAHEQVIYVEKTGIFEKGDWDGSDEIAWLDGGFNFRNRSFREVAGALERRFDITVKLDSNLENCNVYAQIGNEPVDITLRALTRLMGAKLTKTGKSYHISGAGCDSN